VGEKKLTKYLTLEDVKDYAQCSQRYIYYEIERKNLRAYKLGRMLRFDPVDVEMWIKRKFKQV
jgi:excisionase family DNA binding protein